MGLDNNQYRANDDGEPSGTAGRPILGQIDSKELTNTLVVVVRYYGGIKLGASGLANAYKSATRQVLDSCQILIRSEKRTFQIETDHQHIGKLLDEAKKLNFTIDTIEYDPRPKVQLTIDLDHFESNAILLKSRVLGISRNEASLLVDPAVFKIIDTFEAS